MRAIVLVMMATATASADDVRFDAGLTGSTVAIDGRTGTGMVVEIKERATDRLAIGGRVEFGVMFGGELGPDMPVSMAMVACGLVKAEYHLTGGQIRPFVGFGAGAYTIGSETIGSATIESDTGRYVGVAPQIGVDLGRVRVAATYNALVGARLDGQSQNYASLELSYAFAGFATR